MRSTPFFEPDPVEKGLGPKFVRKIVQNRPKLKSTCQNQKTKAESAVFWGLVPIVDLQRNKRGGRPQLG